MQVVTNARTLKVETERRGSELAATGVHFVIKGPDGQVHTGASCTLVLNCAPWY